MHNRTKQKVRSTYMVLSILLCLTFFASFFIGRYNEITFIQVLKILINQIHPIYSNTWSQLSENVVLRIRLPRIIAVIISGASLSAAGATYQSLFSNPMASPDTLGVSSGAGLGAALGILLYQSGVMIQASAFVMGCFSVILVYLIAILISRKKNTILFLVLTGLVISSFFSALLSIIKYIADPYDQLPAITYWLMGSFAATSYNDVWISLIIFVVGIIPLMLIRWRINLLILSTEESYALGENGAVLRVVSIFCSTLLTASAVSVSGGVNWVGLVIPHLSKLIVGNDYRYVLPVSCLMGGAYLLLMDNIARTIVSSEIPIGILTSIIGAPIFFMVLIRNRRALTNEY